MKFSLNFASFISNFVEFVKKIGLGIDLGGTKLSGALFDEQGMASPREWRSVSGLAGEEVGEIIVQLVRYFLDWTKDRGQKIHSLGIAVPGIYYSKKGTVWAPNIPGWEDYPLLRSLAENFDSELDIRIDSDRACYILGEAWCGAAEDCRNAIFLAVGTGIGAGVLIDGKILRGAHDIAGAIGWLAVTHPHLPGYSNYGCFEYHASGAGMARMLGELLQKNKAKLKGMGALDYERLSARDLFVAYEAGDVHAAKVIEMSIEFWGKASANLVSLFNPEKIIFGGGVFGPAVRFLDDIYLEAKKWAQPISIGLVQFEASKLGSDAGLFGAGYLALKD